MHAWLLTYTHIAMHALQTNDVTFSYANTNTFLLLYYIIHVTTRTYIYLYLTILFYPHSTLLFTNVSTTEGEEGVMCGIRTGAVGSVLCRCIEWR